MRSRRRRFDDIHNVAGARIQVRRAGFGVGGLIPATVGLSGGVGGLLTKQSGLSWNA
jgi:hypothetical protein